MSHALVLGLFDNPAAAAAAARGLVGLGIPRERVSIVARSHDEEVGLAQASGASPGSEIEDSRLAGRLGELSAHLLAAIALVMPGIGTIVADGPLAAELGEAAGHAAGGIARSLERSGLSPSMAKAWETSIEQGALLVGAHVEAASADRASAVLTKSLASDVALGSWPD
jgi:hypothetical protein